MAQSPIVFCSESNGIGRHVRCVGDEVDVVLDLLKCADIVFHRR